MFKGKLYTRLLVTLEVKPSRDFHFFFWLVVEKFQKPVFELWSFKHICTKSHISIKHFQDCWPLEFLWCWWINLTITQRFYISNPVFFFLFMLNVGDPGFVWMHYFGCEKFLKMPIMYFPFSAQILGKCKSLHFLTWF